MKPTPVYRFHFSPDEVIAALFPSGIPSQSREIRIEGDEVVVDFVNPKAAVAHEQPAQDAQQPAVGDDDSFPGDQPSHPQAGAAGGNDGPAPKVGPAEDEARELCARRAFQTFLEVKTEEAAQRILLEKCKAESFRLIDTEKYKKAAFRDVVAEFDMWMRG